MPLVPLSQIQNANQINPATGLPQQDPNTKQWQDFQKYTNRGLVLSTPTTSQGSISAEEAANYQSYGVNYSLLADNEERRAERQGSIEKWANATGKMGILAATTFADGTIGTVAGVGNLFTGGEDGKTQFSDFWNNPFSNAMADIGEKVEKALPNYRTHEELDNPWYINMLPGSGGAANFWADTIFKNFGFAIGALAAGSVAGGLANSLLGTEKVAKNIAAQIGKRMGQSEDEIIKLLQSNKLPADQLLGELKRDASYLRRATVASELIGSTAAALGEARIEAINGSRTYYQQLVDSGVDPNLASQQANEMGNIQFALNTALLSGSNYSQFRDLLGGGFKNQKDLVSKIKGNFTDGFTGSTMGMPERIARVLKNPLTEGAEEMGQFAVEKTASDYITRRYDPEATSYVNDFIAASINGLSETLGSAEGWEQGFAGFITGAVGLPNLAKVTSLKDKNVPVWAGGVYDDYKNTKLADTKSAKAAEQLNKLVSNPELANLYYSQVTDASYELEKQRALQKNDVFTFKNAEHAQFFDHVLTAVETGKFEDYLNHLESFNKLSGQELRSAMMVKTGNNTQPIDLYQDKTDAELEEIHRERSQKLVEQAKQIRDFREQIRIKSASRLPAELERGLTYYASGIKNIESRSKELVERLNETLNTPIQKDFIDGEDNPNLTEDMLMLDPINIVDTLETLQHKGNVDKLLDRARRVARAKNNWDLEGDIIQDVVDLAQLAQSRKTFVDTYTKAFADPNKFIEEHNKKIQDAIEQQQVAHKNSTIKAGNKFKDSQGREWVVGAHTEKGKFYIAKRNSEGVLEIEESLKNKTIDELYQYFTENGWEFSGVDQEAAASGGRQIDKTKVQDLIKKIKSIKNPAELKRFWEKQVKPLGLANSGAIEDYITERYYELTGKPLSSAYVIEKETPKDEEVTFLHDLQKKIKQATSIQELSDLMNNEVYVVYPKDSLLGQEVRKAAVARLAELKEIKEKQIVALQNAVDNRLKNWDELLDSMKPIKSRVDSLQKQLDAALLQAKAAKDKPQIGRNAKINKEAFQNALKLVENITKALVAAKEELSLKQGLEYSIQSEIEFLEGRIKQVKDDTRTLKLATQLEEEKIELSEREEQIHRFNKEKLEYQLSLVRKDIKFLNDFIPELELYLEELNNNILPGFALVNEIGESVDPAGLIDRIRHKIGTTNDPVVRAAYQKLLKDPTVTQQMGLLFAQIRVVKAALSESQAKLDKALAKEGGLLDAIKNNERIEALRASIPIFEKILNGDPNDKKNYPGLYKEIEIAKKEAPKSLDPKKLGLKTSSYNNDAENNGVISGLSKEEYDKQEAIFSSARRSLVDLVAGTTNDQEDTDEAGIRYFNFIDRVQIRGHQLRMMIPDANALSEKAKQAQLEGVHVYGKETGSIIWGLVVNKDNKPVDENDNVISEEEIYTKGIYSPLPLNLIGKEGKRYYETEEKAKEFHESLKAFRKNLYNRITKGETPLLAIEGKSAGIPVLIDNATEAFNNDEGLTELTELGETENLDNYIIEIATLTPDGKAYIYGPGTKTAVKAGFIYATDKNTGNVYNVKTSRLTELHTESIINLFKGFANSLTAVNGRIVMSEGSNALASVLPENSRISDEYSSIFKVIEKLVFWTGNNLNDQNKPINTNGKTLFAFNSDSKTPGGEIIAGVNEKGQPQSYPLVTVDENDGTIRFNKALEDRLRAFLPTLHINARSRNLNQNNEPFYELGEVILDENGRLEKVNFVKHNNYKSFLGKKLFSPIIPRVAAQAKGVTQFQNRYLRFDSSWIEIKSKPVSKPTTTTSTSNIEAKKADIESLKKKPYQERVKSLVESGIIDNVYGIDSGRPIIIVNIAGQKIPFYRSLMGTSGKTKNKWFPFFGFGKHKTSDTEEDWFVKGSTSDLEGNFGSKAIAEYSNIINSLFDYDRSLDRPNVLQGNPFKDNGAKSLPNINELLYGTKESGIVNDGGASIEKGYDIIRRINTKYNAELDALKQSNKPVIKETPLPNSGNKPLSSLLKEEDSPSSSEPNIGIPKDNSNKGNKPLRSLLINEETPPFNDEKATNDDIPQNKPISSVEVLTGEEVFAKYGASPSREVLDSLSEQEFNNFLQASKTPDSDGFYRLATFDDVITISVEEEEWFKKTFPNVPYNKVKSLIDSRAWGQFRDSAVYIYENAAEGTAYHEAFHVVSQLFLTAAERSALYNELRAQLKTNLTDKEAEEYIADEFMEFKLGKEIKNAPKRKSFFQQLLDTILNFLFKVTNGRYGTAPSISDIFRNIEAGVYTNKSFSPVKATFNREKMLIAGDTTKSSAFTKDVLSTTTLYFASEIYKSGENLEDLFKGEKLNAEILNKAYANAKAGFEKKAQEYYLAARQYKGTKHEITANKLYDDLKFIIDNFDNNKVNSVRALHQVYMEQYNMKFIETDDFSEHDEKTKDATQLWSTESMKVSTKINASKIIKFLIATLPLKQPIKAETMAKIFSNSSNAEEFDLIWQREFNTTKFILNSLGMPQAVDFGQTFSALTDKLSNTKSVFEQELLMRQLLEVIPGLGMLRSRLKMTKFLNNSTALNFAEGLQLMQFTQTFAKNRNEFVFMMVDEGGRTKFINDNEHLKLNRILSSWASNATKKYLKVQPNGKRLISATNLPVPNNLNHALDILEDLGITFSRLNNVSKDKRGELFRSLLKTSDIEVSTFLSKTGHFIKTINDSSADKPINFYDANQEGDFGFKGDRDFFVNIETSTGFEFTENSTWTIDGERIYLNTLNNFLTNTKNTLNKVKDFNELVEKMPHLSSSYSKNSLWLDKMFINKGSRVKEVTFKMPVILGVKEFGSNKGDNFDDLKLPDMLALWINAGLEGMYPFLRASDNKLERFPGVGELVDSFAINSGNYVEQFYKYLQDEADFQLTEDLSKWDKVNGLQREGLRGIVFDIIKDRNVELYNQLNQKNSATVKERIDANKEAIAAVLGQFFNEKTNELISKLKENKVIEQDTNGSIINYGLNISSEGTGIKVNDKNEIKDVNIISQAALTQAVKKVYINIFMNNIEQTKVLVGHPMFYGNVDNFFKRMTGLTGTKKIVNTDKLTNNFIDANLIRQDGKKSTDYAINEEPVVKTMVIADVNAYSDYYEHYVSEFIKYFESKGLSHSEAKAQANEVVGAYGKMTEADAQGYISLDEFREFLFRTGDWNNELEAWYQWEIQEGWKNKKVYWPNTTVYGDKAGKEIKPVDFGKVVGNPQKPQHFGPLAENGFIPGFYKLSVIPLVPSLTYGRKIDKMRKAMLDKTSPYYQTGVVVAESGNKVGTKLYNDGQNNTTNYTQKLNEPIKNPIYNNNGDINVNDQSVKPQFTFYHNWGIQLDVAPKVKKENIFGTQMGKQILNATHENGEAKPMRFMKDGVLQAASKQATEDRVQEYLSLVDQRIQLGLNQLEKEFGLKKQGNNYVVSDPTTLRERLIQAATDKDMPDNVIESINQLGDGFGIDALINAEKVEQVLSAIADKMTVSKKFHGGAKIQGAYTLFEQDDKLGREFTVINKSTEEVHRGIKDLSKFFEKKDPKNYTVTVSSSTLKTYKNEKGVVTKMQVYLPHFFSELMQIEGDKLYPLIDKKLLSTIIGFRIPTQGMNSIESIEIVGFLPQSAGELIILPSEVVAKAGSDFDIDKMNVLLPNYKINLFDKTKGYVYSNIQSIDFVPYEDRTNNIKAIDNRILELLSEFATSPDNFFQLTLPNSSDKLKNAAKRIQWIMNAKPSDLSDEKAFEKWVKEEEGRVKKLSFYNIADLNYILGVTVRNLVGKALVGIGALQSTNNVMAQMVNLSIAPKITNSKGETELTHINLTGGVKEGEIVRLSSLLNADKDDIWELLSQFINAAVDAAKDPFILDLNVLTNTAATFAYLLRAGVPLRTLSAFMSQPVIKTYIKNQSIYESHLAEVNGTKKFRDEIIDLTLSEYALPEGKDKVFTADELELMIRDGSKVQGFHKYQGQILKDFLRYQETAKALSEAITATTYDTKPYKNTGELMYRLMTTQKVIDKGEIVNYEKLFQPGGYFNSMRNANKEALEMFKPLVQAIGNPEVKKVFEEYLTIFINNSVSEDEREQAIRKFKANFITYLLQSGNIKISGQNQGRVTSSFESLFKGENSLPHQINKYKSSQEYVPNLLIEELYAIFTGPVDNLRFYNTRLDKLEADGVTNAWLELFDKKHQLAVDLAKFIILQSGVENSPINFISYMPAEIYGEIVKNTMVGQMSEGQAKSFVAQFFRQAANLTKDFIVPDVTFKSKKASPEYPLVKKKVRNPAYKKGSEDKSIPKYLPKPELYINPNYTGSLSGYFPVDKEGRVPVLGEWDMRNSSSVYLYGMNDTKAVLDTPSNSVPQPVTEQIDEASQIYSQLGTKTKSENVVIKSVYQREGIQYAKSIGGVFSLRVNNSDKHFGNPFSSVQSEIAKGLTATKSTKESVEKYIDWVINSQDERAIWIREQLKSGILKGKPIVYYKELGEPSHATALDYLINKYNWNKKQIDEKQEVVDSGTNQNYKVLEIYLPTGNNLDLTIRVQNNKTGEKGSFSIDNTGRWIISKFNKDTNDYEIVAQPLTQDQIINNAKLALGENIVNEIINIKKQTDKVEDYKGGEKFDKFLELTKQIKDTLESKVDSGIDTSRKIENFINTSGGAKGGDMTFDKEGKKRGFTNHNHITVADYDKLSLEQKEELNKQYLEVVKFLGRGIISKDTYAGKLVRRDMIQANTGNAIYGVTELIKPGIKGRKGYNNKMSYSIPEGGTGYATARSILLGKPTYIFNQSDAYGNEIGWYKWDKSSNDFIKTNPPTLVENYTGIGSQEINELGIQAIKDLYDRTLQELKPNVVDSSFDDPFVKCT